MAVALAVEERVQILQGLLDRAATDPQLRSRLAADPFGELARRRFRLDGEFVKHLMGIPEATDQELLDLIRARISMRALDACKVG